MVLENGQNDEVLDDSGLVIRTDEGIVVIAGCSHSGICNFGALYSGLCL